MGKFISDEEMNALQAESPKAKKFISDEEMEGLKAQPPKEEKPSEPLVAEEDKPWAATSFLQGMGREVPGGSWIDEAEGKIGSAFGGDEEAWKQGSLERYDRSKHTNPTATKLGGMVGRGMGYVVGSKLLGPLGPLAEAALHGAGKADPGNRAEGAMIDSAMTGVGMLGGAALNPLLKYGAGKVIPQPIVDALMKKAGQIMPKGPAAAPKPGVDLSEFRLLTGMSKAPPPPKPGLADFIPSPSTVGGMAGNNSADFLRQYYSSKKFRESQ